MLSPIPLLGVSRDCACRILESFRLGAWGEDGIRGSGVLGSHPLEGPPASPPITCTGTICRLDVRDILHITSFCIIA